MSKQTVFRVAKNRDNPYVMLNKKFLEHPQLSYRAKGILSYILSKPDHWNLNVSDLVNHGKEGRDAIYSAVKELVQHGFMQHICYREHGKISHYEYIVYEQPLETPIERITYTSVQKKEAGTDHLYSAENPETDSWEEEEVPLLSVHPDFPETAAPLDASGVTVPPGNPDPENPTQVSNDFSKELINKTRSSRARCTIFDLWQETFQAELNEREYEALLKVCSRTTLAKNLCLIQEHHHVPSILSPFSFVMSCVAGGGYNVPVKGTALRPRSEGGKYSSPPIPKAVQKQLSERRQPYPEPEMTSEELARKMEEVKQMIRRLNEDQPEFDHEVTEA
jgi:hypothetical protein